MLAPEMVMSLSQMLKDAQVMPVGGIRARASSISKPLNNLEMEKYDIYAPQEQTDSDSEGEKERERERESHGMGYSLPALPAIGASVSRTTSPSSGRYADRTMGYSTERASGHTAEHTHNTYSSKSHDGGAGMVTGAEHRVPFQGSKRPDVSPTAMRTMMQSVNTSPPGPSQSHASEPPAQVTRLPSPHYGCVMHSKAHNCYRRPLLIRYFF